MDLAALEIFRAVAAEGSVTRAAERLGWTPAHSTLDEMISTAWAWHQRPGYRA